MLKSIQLANNIFCRYLFVLTVMVANAMFLGCGSSETRPASPSVSMLGILNDSTVVMGVSQNEETCDETMVGNTCYGEHTVSSYLAVFSIESSPQMKAHVKIDTSFSFVSQISDTSFLFFNKNNMFGVYVFPSNHFDELSVELNGCYFNSNSLRATPWHNGTVLLLDEKANGPCQTAVLDMEQKTVSGSSFYEEDKWMLTCGDLFYSPKLDKPICANLYGEKKCQVDLIVDEKIKDSATLANQACSSIVHPNSLKVKWFGHYLAVAKPTENELYSYEKEMGDFVMSVNVETIEFDSLHHELWIYFAGIIRDNVIIRYSSFPLQQLWEKSK